MKKRLLSLAMAVLMIFSLFPFTAAAADVVASGTCGENVWWKVTNDNTLTFGGTGDMTDYSWTEESERPWSAYKKTVQAVVVEEGVTSIGGNACYWFENVKSLSLPSTLTKIGSFAFKFCSITTLDLPESMVEIGDGAFADCHNLKELVIPNGVKTIGHDAFVNEYGLESLTLPDSLESIDYYAFSNCPLLTELVIPGSVHFVGNNAFKNCTGLTSLTIEEGACGFERQAFISCTGLKSVALPSSMTTIPGYLFSNCSSLESVTLPNTVTSIEGGAFYQCPALTDVYYGGTREEWNAMTIESSGNEPLLNAALHPVAVVVDSGSCGENVTYELDSEGLLTIRGEGEMTSHPWDAESVKTVVIESGVTSICSCAFSDCSGLTDVTIPDGVTQIGTYAFDQCSALRSVSLPESVNYIGEDAFQNCSALTSVTIPNGLSVIDNATFQNCFELQTVTIPSSVTVIGQSAFYNDNKITDVYYGGSEAAWGRVSIKEFNTPLFNAEKHYTAPTITASGNLGENITWTLDNEGLLTISGYAPMPNSTWSSPFNDYLGYIERIVVEPGVASIGNYAFAGCTKIRSIEIPDSVASIGDYAFSNCLSLPEIEIPNSVESIGQYAFQNCSSLKHVELPNSVTSLGQYAFYYCTGMESIVLPNSLTSIANDAFMSCRSLQEITIPDSLTSISDSMFYGCSSLTSVTIPDSVTRIGISAFNSCSALTSVTIPDSVSSIGGRAFYECTNLKEVTLPSGTVSWTYTYASSNGYTFKGCSALETVNGLENKSVPQYCFSGCSSLREANVGKDVGAYAFANCTSLAAASAGGSIGEYAFQGCSALESLTMTDGTTINAYGVGNCAALKTVTLPVTLTEVAANAFRGSDALEDVYYDGSETDWSAVSIKATGNDSLLNANMTFGAEDDPIVDAGMCGENVSYELDRDGLLTIRGEGEMTSHPWDAESVKTVVIESGVTSIPEYAFQSCVNLESITIPESVKQIKWDAFDGCGSLTDVWYDGARIDWVDIGIDGGNSPLLEAQLHCAKPLYVVDSGACGEHVSWVLDSDCVLTIRGEGPMTDYVMHQSIFQEYRNQICTVNIEPGVTSIGDWAFEQCERLSSITIPDGVTRIGNQAFWCCSSLTSIPLPDTVVSIGVQPFVQTGITSITIPNGVTCLGDSLLDGCTYLTEVVIPDSVTSIGSNAFDNCFSLKSLVIPPNVTYIGWYAFQNCHGLESITLPEGIKSIQEGTFIRCYNLKEVSIPESVTEIGSSAFESCESLQSLNIPSGVTSIGDSAFLGCTALTELALPERLTSLGARAFSDCSSLTSIAIPSGVTEIGDQTFQNCAALESAEIPATVTRIGASAFAGCSALTEITTYGSIAENAFKNCAALREAHVLDCRAIGGSAFSGCSALETVYLPDALTSVAAYAFNGADALRDVWYDDAQTEWDQIDIAVLGNSALLNAALHPAELDHEHDWSGWTVVTPATRDAEGLQERVCSVCGRTRTRVTPRLDYIVSNPNWVYDFEDEPAVFRIETQGENLTYQWQISTDNGLTWENLDCTEPVYECVLTAEMHNARVRCVVTDSFGSSIASDFACISIKQPMRLISGPQDAAGRVGGEVRFSVNFEGSVSSLKWYCSKNGGLTWKKVSESSWLDVAISDASCDGWLYRCVLKDSNGSVVSTGAAKLMVLPEILTQPQNVSGKIGQTVTVSTEAAGANLTYRWEFSIDGGQTWQDVGFYDNQFSVTIEDESWDGWLCRCAVTSGSGAETVTDTVRLTVLTGLKITQQPQDYEGPVGSTAAFTVAAEGEGLTYRWQYKDVGGTWLNSSFKTASMSCKVTADRDGREYRCVIRDAYQNRIISEPARITALEPTTITQQPQDYEGLVGSTATFTVAATGDGLTYRWQYKDVGGSKWLNSSFKSPTMSCKLTAERDGRQYRCVITDVYGMKTTSDAVTMKILAGPTITQQPQDFTGKVGETATFSVAATGVGLTYRWEYKDVGGSWAPSSFKTATMSCRITAARDGRQYRCIVTDEYDRSVTSAPAAIIVSP